MRYPYIFTKFRNTLIGAGDDIVLPRLSKQVDWEVELAVVIGRRGKYIAKGDAYSYVAGYTVANDISFRDLQIPPGPREENRMGLNWVMGKGLDSSFPLGPWLVTRDELQNPHNLAISLSVNGEQRQSSNTGEMIFKIDELIEYISGGITLSPGDIISTGTPAGIARRTGVPYLKDGDRVEARIEGIGTLENVARAEK